MGLWKTGFDECIQESGTFSAPETLDDLDELKQARSAAVSAGTIKHTWVWVNADDIEDEGKWVFNGSEPFEGWAEDKPTHDVNKDCALILPDGKWYDYYCGKSYYVACRQFSGKTKGSWRLADYEKVQWKDGFEACRRLGSNYKFDVPDTEESNEELKSLLGYSRTAWINYTDDRFEGTWTPGWWTNWFAGEPNNSNGNEDCADLKWDGSWNDSNCSNEKPVLCRYKDTDDWKIYIGHFVPWEDANYWCNQQGDGWWFAAPDSEEATDTILDKYQSSWNSRNVWIRFNDLEHEGYWNGIRSNKVDDAPLMGVTSPYFIDMEIDIMPGKDENIFYTMNPNHPLAKFFPNNTLQPKYFHVALLSSDQFFPPFEVDTSMITFGKTGDEPSLIMCEHQARDVNDDGREDLVCLFCSEDTGFEIGDGEGILKGHTVYGMPFGGIAPIQVKTK